MPGSFLDTNVLVYLLEEDDTKAGVATTLVDAGAVISVHVLNELTAVAMRKRPDQWERLNDFLVTIAALLDVRPVTIETHLLGLELMARHRFAVHDAMIVSAALLADCGVLWSEDMQDGLVVYESLTIRNPFA